MKLVILAIFLGLVLLFGCVGQTNTQSTDVFAKNELGQTALMLAAQNGQTDLCNSLIDKGAEINAKDNGGKTSLSYAIVSYQLGESTIDTARLLMERGADVNVKYNFGTTPLMDTSYYSSLRINRTDMIKLLIVHGADVNAFDDQGHTALMYAIDSGDSGGWYAPNEDVELKVARQDTVKLLIEKGADVNARYIYNGTAEDARSKNIVQETPLELALKLNDTDIAYILKQAGATE